MFNMKKDYKFSFNKYRVDCAKDKIPIGNWAKQCDGARVLISKDRKQGGIHCYVGQPQIMVIDGIPRQQREELRCLVDINWCEEA